MTHTGPRSALIVEVPEAEHVVAPYRQRFDANAGLGIPAHITVLYPFMPPGEISPSVLARLEHLFSTVSRFRFLLDRSDWFGTDVLWLAPDSPQPFAALTRAVVRAFPAFLPYGGQFTDPVPHLTVGHSHPVTDLQTAEQSINPHLPIDALASAVTLMTRESDAEPWARSTTFALV